MQIYLSFMIEPSRAVQSEFLTSFSNSVFGFIYTCFYAASVHKKIIDSASFMPITMAED
jgi:hypothetical protein